MTDEETAEQYVSNQGNDNILYFGEDQINLSSLKREAFLAGLKVGRGNGKSQRCCKTLVKCAMSKANSPKYTEE